MRDKIEIRDVSKEYRTWGPDGDPQDVWDEMYEVVRDGRVIFKTSSKMEAQRRAALIQKALSYGRRDR